jgi:hypothetical protein
MNYILNDLLDDGVIVTTLQETPAHTSYLFGNYERSITDISAP